MRQLDKEAEEGAKREAAINQYENEHWQSESSGSAATAWLCLSDGCYELVVSAGDAGSEVGFAFLDVSTGTGFSGSEHGAPRCHDALANRPPC